MGSERPASAGTDHPAPKRTTVSGKGPFARPRRLPLQPIALEVRYLRPVAGSPRCPSNCDVRLSELAAGKENE